MVILFVVEICLVVWKVEVAEFVSIALDESIIIDEVEVVMLLIRESVDEFVCVNGHGS